MGKCHKSKKCCCKKTVIIGLPGNPGPTGASGGTATVSFFVEAATGPTGSIIGAPV